MKTKESKIFNSSVNNVTNKLEHYGDANIEKISLLKLIYKYVEYSTTALQLQRLDKMVSHLQMSCPFICLESQAAQGYTVETVVIPVVDIGGVTENQPPTLTAQAMTVTDPNLTYTYSYADLFAGYSDAEGGLVSSFVIDTLPTPGVLTHNGIQVVAGTLLADPTLLVYTRDGVGAYGDSFTYSAYDDDSQLPLVSNIVAMTITVDALVTTNQPATVGDRAQYTGNRLSTIFTIADFTTEAIAPYFDPETNALDAIRIDEISDANTGVYYYYGSPVVVGQVITAADLTAEAFYHEGADVNSIATDAIEVSVRDTGSLIWVQ